MNGGHLELVDMTPLDLNGVLFVHFPHNETLEESRQHLERLIRRCDLEEISPFYIWVALSDERFRHLMNMPPHVLERMVMEKYPGRFQPTYPENGAPPKPKPAQKKPEIKLKEWDF